MIRTGTILSSRYEILEQIGSGGMAYVYKARDRKLSRLVAIKILKEEFCKDKSFVAKFRMEAQAAAGLSHNNRWGGSGGCRAGHRPCPVLRAPAALRGCSAPDTFRSASAR